MKIEEKKAEEEHASKGFAMSTPAPREKSPEPLPEVDASKLYEELVESENTTESSSMKFKNVNDNLYGRNS